MISTALVYAETMSVDVEGTSYDIEYFTTGVTITGAESDVEAGSLILFVDVTESSGILEITFERIFFDSIYEGEDEEFYVLADLDDANFEETETTALSRTLSIQLPSGTEDVEIIGYSFNNLVTEPEVTEPEVTEPEVTEPEVTEPEVTEPEVTEPEVTEEVTEPEVTEPEVTEPEVTDDAPKTQCGPGTILQDGACVLDERCGPGTILQDGVCVLDSTPQTSDSSLKGMGTDLVMGLMIAFAGAGVVGIVFALIAKANKSN
jgi:hypothetical protein